MYATDRLFDVPRDLLARHRGLSQSTQRDVDRGYRISNENAKAFCISLGKIRINPGHLLRLSWLETPYVIGSDGYKVEHV